MGECRADANTLALLRQACSLLGFQIVDGGIGELFKLGKS